MFSSNSSHSPASVVFLNIPASDIEQARKYGCRWNSQFNAWSTHDVNYAKSGIKEDIQLHAAITPFKMDGNHKYWV
jgi:hypothetical protein